MAHGPLVFLPDRSGHTCILVWYRDLDPQQELQTGQVRDLVLVIFFFFFFYQNIQFDSRKIFRVMENICMTEKKIRPLNKNKKKYRSK